MSVNQPKIIGITEKHGIAQEYSQFPPEGYQYQFLTPRATRLDKILSSSAKGFFSAFEDQNVALVEAPIFPANTNKPWIYTPAEFTATANFGLCGLPLPRQIRLKLIEHVFKKNNFKKLIFKSQAGLTTLKKYAKGIDADIVAKCAVVHPCINIPTLPPRQPKEHIDILFVGDFFRKGGANVVDVFEQLQTKYPNIRLNIVGNNAFDTDNQSLKALYRDKIAKNPAITHGSVPRPELISTIYPNADIFVSPTYQETFGFAILEALAFGLPVISTAHFAIPEIITDQHSGLLIETDQFDFIRNFKGYYISHIPADFHQYMNEQLYQKLELLISQPQLRQQLADNGIKLCEGKFSPAIRAAQMKTIYDEALA